MAIPISSGSFSKALWPGINAWYGKAYNEYPIEWTNLFDKNTSSKQYEEDVGVSTFGLPMLKSEGGAVSYDTMRQGFITRYTHAVYALGFMITREMYEDDQYDVVGKSKSESLAFSMRQGKEILAASVYNLAFSTSRTYGDGSALLVNNHPNVAGGTQSNILATASDLSEAALEQACIDIAGWTNDRGLIIALKPDQLVGPWQLEFEAHRILKSQGRVGTDLNDPNALKELGKFSKGFFASHFLTDTDAWFVRTNAPHGMKYFERRSDEFTSDNDFDTENAKFKATMRFSFGNTDWRALYGSPGA